MDLLSHMQIFVDIADHGSLVSVARARKLAPSAVTASLQRLEEHVGAMLVVRSTRNLSLTSEGQDFLERCRRVLEEADNAVESVSAEGVLKGPIRLTCINDFGRARLAALIDGFLARHPDVRIDLSLSDRVVDLIEGGFDLAIRTGPLVDSRLKAKLLLRGGRSVCASPAYWDAHGRPARPEELADHNCLVQSRTSRPQSVWSFLDAGKKVSVSVSGDRTADDGGLLREWAVAGGGVVLKSDYDVVNDLRAGRLEAVLPEFADQDVNLYAVHVAGRHPTRRGQSFIDYLIAEMTYKV